MHPSPRRSRPGFTLIEVLVASSVMLILGIVVAVIFIQSTKSLGQTQGRLEIVQAARHAANRLQFIFSSGAYIPGAPTVLYPDIFTTAGGASHYNERNQIIDGEDPSTWPRYVALQTTEDSLALGFNPNEIHDLPTMDPAIAAAKLKGYRSEAQRIFTYLIWWEGSSAGASGIDALPNEDKVLVIGRVQPDLSGGPEYPVIRQRPWAGGYGYPASNDPFKDLDKDPVTGKPNIRILARGLEDVSFLKRDDAGIQVSILARKRIISQLGSQNKEFRLDSVMQIPAEISI